MRDTHPTPVRRLVHPAWAAALLALALAASLALPARPATADPAANHDAPELSDVRVGENIPVAPVSPLTDDTVVGRNSGGLGINPDDPDHIVAFTWEAYADAGETCEVHVSRDGGATWTTDTIPVPEGWNTEGEGNRGYCSQERGGNRNSSHGHVQFGTGDDVYTAFAGIQEGKLGNSALVAKSTDGGTTWQAPVEAIEGGANEFFDEPHMFFVRVTVDPGAGEGGADRLYVHGRNSPSLDVTMAVSDDGGATWSDPVHVNRAGATPPDDVLPENQGFLASEVVIGPDGDAFVVWRSAERPAGWIRVGRSSDGGQTWTVDDVTPVLAATLPGDPPSDQVTSGYPRLAVDGSSGALYVVYHQHAPLPEATAGDVRAQDHWYDPDAGVYLVKSTDDGATWTSPLQVNDELPADSGNVHHQTRHPNVSVAPNGRVDVAWMDRRHWIEALQSEVDGGQERPGFNPDDWCTHSHRACTESRTSDIYYAFSEDGGASFSTNKRVTDYSSNNEVGWEYNIGPFWWHGLDLDYAAGDDLVVSWSDSRRGRARTGGVTVGSIGAENNDLFMTTVEHGSTAAPRVETHAADDAPTLSATLSEDVAYMGGVQGRLSGNRITSPFSQAVVVNEDDWASALVGSVLARRYMGPVLATPAGSLPAAVSAEIDRMELFAREEAPEDLEGVDTTDMVHRDLGGAFILGGTTAVSGAIQTDLEGRDIRVTRVDGDPVAMAAEVALHLDDRFDRHKDALDPTFRPAFDAVIVVNPDDPEAASASALAASRRLPVLFVEQDTIPAATQSALDELDIDRTVVVGDTDAVSATVFDALPSAERLSGDDVYATSSAVVHESSHRGMPANVIYIVGDDPMHAALTGSSVARAGGLLVQAPNAGRAQGMATIAELGLDDYVDKVVLIGGADEACPADLVPDSPFTDIAGNVHFDNIGCIVWYGLTQGTTDTTYSPSNAVTRDQMASFIARLMETAGFTFEAPSDQGFGDIAGNVHADRINQLAAVGVVQGTSATTYAPRQEVRRDQMASFLVRAYEVLDGQELAREDTAFTDIAGNTHQVNIEKSATAGFAQGTTATTYAPSNSVRRDQMGSFLARVLERGIDDGHVSLPTS